MLRVCHLDRLVPRGSVKVPVAVDMARLLADIHETVDPAKVSVQGAEGPWLESGNRRRLVDGQGSLRVGSALSSCKESASTGQSEAGAQS